MKLLAIDPSLSSTGWSLFSLDKEELLVSGIVRAPGTSYSLGERMRLLQQDVEHLLETLVLGAQDILVCEGPAPLVLNPQSALKVEGVRGVFEAVARSRGLTVPGRLNPRTIQAELMGMRGKQLAREEVKTWAREIAQKLHGDRLQRRVDGADTKVAQDIIDASLIGSLAVTKIKTALRCGGDIYSAFQAKESRGRGGKRVRWSESDLKKVSQG